MADHIREQIMDAVVTTLTGLTTTGANVFRGRVFPQEETKLPGLLIYQGSDTPTEDSSDESLLQFIDRELTIRVEAWAQAPTTQIDQTLNLIAKEVTIAMQADYTQGLTSIINTMEGNTSEPSLSGEGSKTTGSLDMEWLITYRTTRANPSI